MERDTHPANDDGRKTAKIAAVLRILARRGAIIRAERERAMREASAATGGKNRHDGSELPGNASEE